MRYLGIFFTLLFFIVTSLLLSRNVSNAMRDLTDVFYVAAFAICMMLIIDGIRWLMNKYKDSEAEFWDVRGEVIEFSYFRKRRSTLIGGIYSSKLYKYIHEYKYIKVRTDDDNIIDIVYRIDVKTTELDYTTDSEYHIGKRVYFEVKKYEDDPYYYDSRITII